MKRQFVFNSYRASILLVLPLLAWVGNALYAFAGSNELLKIVSPALVGGAMITFLFIHGLRCYGRKAVCVFVVSVFVVSWTFESISILTGFPFGKYHYTEIMEPFLGHVPIYVLPAYCAMGYVSWSMARIVLGRIDERFGKFEMYTIPVIAAALMVVWDISMDPLRATVEGRWVWVEGGTHFGVPATNFAGWFIVTWTMFQVFAIFLRSTAETKELAANTNSFYFWLAVPMMYSAFAIEYILNPFIADDMSKTILVNSNLMQLGDLYRQIAFLAATTMVPLSIFAAWRLQACWNNVSGPPPRNDVLVRGAHPELQEQLR